MPSSDTPFSKQFQKLKDAKSNGSGDDSDSDNHNCCNNLSMCVVIILKIIVVAASSLLIFDSCSIGYMYDYLLKSLIIAGVMFGVPCLLAICLYGSVAADSLKAFAVISTFMIMTITAGAIAQIVILGELFDQHPEDTLLFFDTFWTNPIFPANCTQGQDLTFVEIGMGVVKYDAFTFMLCLLILACVCSCAIVCTCCGVGLSAFDEESKSKAAAGGAPIAVV